MKLWFLCITMWALLAISWAKPMDVYGLNESDEGGEHVFTFTHNVMTDCQNDNFHEVEAVEEDEAVEEEAVEEEADEQPTLQNHFAAIMHNSMEDDSPLFLRGKRAIRADADTHNHILASDLAKSEYDKLLKLKRSRRSNESSNSSEEDSSEEKGKPKDDKAAAAAKVESKDAVPKEDNKDAASTVAEVKAEAGAEAVTSSTEAAARRRRQAMSLEDNSSEEIQPDAIPHLSKRSATTSEENSSEEKDKHTPAKAPEARRRRQVISDYSEEKDYDILQDNAKEAFISLSGEQNEKVTSDENGKYEILSDDKDKTNSQHSKDITQEDYATGCEGNDASDESNELNETFYKHREN